jgi:hypothetical protein
MYRRIMVVLGVLLAGTMGAVAIGLTDTASAAPTGTTLGATTEPNMELGGCMPGDLIGQGADSASTPYVVPADAGGLFVTAWSSNVTGDTPGSTLTLWVVAPDASNYTSVATDGETLPNPLPSSGVVTFTVSSPIPVQEGDTFALTSSTSADGCTLGYDDDEYNEQVFFAQVPANGGAGQAVTPIERTGPYKLDLSVTLGEGSRDASVTASAQPASITAGSLALLTDTVANNGPSGGPITVTDTVPSGLSIDAVSAPGGTCTTAGQNVNCTVSSVASGSSAPVYIVVSTSAAGSYLNAPNVTVPDATDPTQTNDSGSATLSVTPVPAPGPATATPAATTTVSNTVTRAVTTTPTSRCSVVALKGVRERVAEEILTALHCKVGQVTTATSPTVAKGDVIAATPGSGTFVTGRLISLRVSRGKPTATKTRTKGKAKVKTAPLTAHEER